MREGVQEAVGGIAFDRGVNEKAANGNSAFPSYVMQTALWRS
jgi:hypothetical protein